MARRGAPSRIRRLPSEQRAFVERLLREDRHTLDEMLTAIRERFPDATVSRSGLHRYKASVEELAGRMREIDRAAQALVGELGEDIGDRAGALLANAVTTLATNAALRANESDEVSIDEVRKMAVAAKNALDTRRISLAERRAIAQEAREALQREQSAKLDKVVKEAGLTDDVADTFRRKVLGLKT
ncbi:DUF3486 family protein [Xanthomonadaceae bacterium XH05]|nr:DUF3486 family protein [Xanthomonadaceae bacterium XH05]